MSNQALQSDPQILLTAVRELDRLARRFRRKLRDVAVELSREAGHLAPIGPETVLQAVPRACQELLSKLNPGFGEERGSDGRKKGKS
ncbi:MAG: hypothetical protein ABR915_08760 [Thermoguttaceae bacterium]|jgi:hypothetical protein